MGEGGGGKQWWIKGPGPPPYFETKLRPGGLRKRDLKPPPPPSPHLLSQKGRERVRLLKDQNPPLVKGKPSSIL